jgi:hypothetical protein
LHELLVLVFCSSVARRLFPVQLKIYKPSLDFRWLVSKRFERRINSRYADPQLPLG